MFEIHTTPAKRYFIECKQFQETVTSNLHQQYNDIPQRFVEIKIIFCIKNNEENIKFLYDGTIRENCTYTHTSSDTYKHTYIHKNIKIRNIPENNCKPELYTVTQH